MLDDADYNDFGYYSTDAVTPNIDSIARQGGAQPLLHRQRFVFVDARERPDRPLADALRNKPRLAEPADVGQRRLFGGLYTCVT